jgi:hypothetical protein
MTREERLALRLAGQQSLDLLRGLLLPAEAHREIERLAGFLKLLLSEADRGATHAPERRRS